MADDAELQNRIGRIADLIGQIESTADPNARAMAKDLLESLMAFHGAALERILEIASEAGEAGKNLIRRCGRDELVGNLLLLYGLHPEDLHSRVTVALEKLRSYLESHAATAEVASIGQDGTITVRLNLQSCGCGSTTASLKSALEAALLNAVPDATSIVLEATGAAASTSGFVPVGQLLNGSETLGTSAGCGPAGREG